MTENYANYYSKQYDFENCPCYCSKQYDFEKELKSFVDIASDIEHQTISSSMMEFGLSFDRKYYKANTEVSL